MKVFIQYDKNDTGKGQFLSRLERAIAKIGVTFEYDSPLGCNVTLSFTHWRKPCSLPSVLRIDGIHLHLTKNVEWRNEQIGKDIKDADAVIWQSKFCYDIVGGLLGVGKKNYTIFNGMDPADYDSVVSAQSPYRRNIVFSAKWRNKTREGERYFKRYKDSAKIARDYTEMDQNTCAWILGNTPDQKYASERVVYTGWLEPQQVKAYLKMADCVVHIPYFDWCPNSVVESLCAGCYGIVGNSGGQAEFVGKYGTVVQIDKRVKPKMVNAVDVPKIDRGLVIHAIADYFRDMPRVVLNPEIHIDYVAARYKEVFDAVAR